MRGFPTVMRDNSTKLCCNIVIFALTLLGWSPTVTTANQKQKTNLPEVTSMGVPTYPLVLRVAQLEGIVHLTVETDGRKIKAVHVNDGPQLLGVAAERNLQTWEFSPHEPTSFQVTYRYKLVGDLKVSSAGTAVVLRLPTEVDISALPHYIVDLSPDKR